MGNSPNEQQLQWSWWKATWDCFLILFSASLLSYAAVISLPPSFYQALFPGIEPTEMQLGPYILLLFFWPSSQAWIIFKWMEWRGVRHAILPLWPLAVSMRKASFLAVSLSAAALFAYFVLGHFNFFSPSSDLEFYIYVMNSRFAPMMVVSGVIAAPIAEEAIFRGFMQSAFQSSRIGFWGASLVVSCMWSLIHLYEWSATLLIIVIGVALTWLRRKTGSLVPGMVAHAIINLVLFLNFVGAEV
jgi:membrane protease YdiL (CAAX protease family)